MLQVGKVMVFLNEHAGRWSLRGQRSKARQVSCMERRIRFPLLFSISLFIWGWGVCLEPAGLRVSAYKSEELSRTVRRVTHRGYLGVVNSTEIGLEERIVFGECVYLFRFGDRCMETSTCSSTRRPWCGSLSILLSLSLSSLYISPSLPPSLSPPYGGSPSRAPTWLSLASAPRILISPSACHPSTRCPQV